MTKYDVKRREQLIRTLEKAKQQAEEAFVYLVAGGNMEAAADTKLTFEHVEIALERLTTDRSAEVGVT